MRALYLIAAVTTAVSPSLAQTVVGSTRRPQDVDVRIIKSEVTAEQLRKLKAEIEARIVRNRWLDSVLVQGVRDSIVTPERMKLEDEAERNLFEVLAKQRDLAIGCAKLRSERIPGTLGLDIDEAVESIFKLRPNGDIQSLTMLFGRLPRIMSIESGSPAEKAGVRVGDVWTAINGKLLTGHVTFDELLTPGTSVTIRVIRDGSSVELPQTFVAIKKSDYPEDACDSGLRAQMFMFSPFELRELSLPKPLGSGQGGARQLGFPGGGTMVIIKSTMAIYAGATLQPLDDDWRKLISVQGDGLIVVDLPPGSLAEASGLRKFDVIRQVNGEPVASADAFQRVAGRQRTLVFTVTEKDGATRTIKIESR